MLWAFGGEEVKGKVREVWKQLNSGLDNCCILNSDLDELPPSEF